MKQESVFDPTNVYLFN